MQSASTKMQTYLGMHGGTDREQARYGGEQHCGVGRGLGMRVGTAQTMLLLSTPTVPVDVWDQVG